MIGRKWDLEDDWDNEANSVPFGWDGDDEEPRPKKKKRTRPTPPAVIHLGRHDLTAIQAQLFRELVDVGFKRLSAKYHPDHGGDTDSQRALNELRAIVREIFK